MIDNVNLKWFVYIHTVPKEISKYKYDKYYIGITSQNPPDLRWDGGWGYVDQLFYKAIKKYGWDNIKHEILYSGLTQDEAIAKEKELIIQYDSLWGRHGYNVSPGGIENWNCGFSENEHPTVYLNENICFRSIRYASNYTGDDSGFIKMRATYMHKNKKEPKKTKTHSDINNLDNQYCYLEDYWRFYEKYRGKRSISNALPIVHLQSGKLFLGYRDANQQLGLKLHGKSVIDVNKYEYLRSKGRLFKKDRYMLATDYLKMFNVTAPII